MMSLGMKVATPGKDVGNPDSKTGREDHKQSDEVTMRMVAVLSLAFILGAKDQIDRYRAVSTRIRNNASAQAMYYLHEGLTLLEDLDTLSWYTQKCGEKHILNKAIRNMRNHARHDLRENIDHVNHKGRRDRVKALGINPGLMVDVRFDESSIKIGNTELSIKEADEYVKWAEGVLTLKIENGVNDGSIAGDIKVK